MRALSITPTLAALLALTACEPSSTTPAVPGAVAFRSDASVAGFVGAPVTRRDSIWSPIDAEPLADLGEPPFRGATAHAGSRALRFTWIRSFHPTIIVRVMDDRTTCHVVTTIATPRASRHYGGVDGSFWLLERLDARGHAMLLDWSPDRYAQRAIFDAGMAFLRAANVMPKVAREIY